MGAQQQASVDSGPPYWALSQVSTAGGLFLPPLHPFESWTTYLEMTEEKEMYMLRPRASVSSDQSHSMEMCLSGQLENTIRDKSSYILKGKVRCWEAKI